MPATSGFRVAASSLSSWGSRPSRPGSPVSAAFLPFRWCRTPAPDFQGAGGGGNGPQCRVLVAVNRELKCFSGSVAHAVPGREQRGSRGLCAALLVTLGQDALLGGDFVCSTTCVTCILTRFKSKVRSCSNMFLGRSELFLPLAGLRVGAVGHLFWTKILVFDSGDL